MDLYKLMQHENFENSKNDDDVFLRGIANSRISGVAMHSLGIS